MNILTLCDVICPASVAPTRAVLVLLTQYFVALLTSKNFETAPYQNVSFNPS